MSQLRDAAIRSLESDGRSTAITTEREFDVFISYSSEDRQIVVELTQALKRRGLNVWMDQEQIRPGQLWQESLEDIVRRCKAVAVCCGIRDVQRWQNVEVRSCLSQFVDRGIPVIPVLIPGAMKKRRLSAFLQQFHRVDLSDGLAPEGLKLLEWGITGKRIDTDRSPDTAHDPLEELPLPLVQLHRQFHIAKESIDRHHFAYSFWEGALRLLAFAAVVELPELGERTSGLAKPLAEALCEISPKGLMDLLRQLLPYLEDDEHFGQLHDVLFGEGLVYLPHTAHLHNLLCRRPGGVQVRIKDLFANLVGHRKRCIDHLANESLAAHQHEQYATALLQACVELFTKFDVLATRKLVFIDGVRKSASGEWIVSQLILEGQFPRLRSFEVPAETEEQMLPLPGRAYLAVAGDEGVARRVDKLDEPLILAPFRHLAPLIRYDAKREEFLFFNGYDTKTGVKYLSYLADEQVIHDGAEVLIDDLIFRITGGSDRKPLIAWDLGDEITDCAPHSSDEYLGDYRLIDTVGHGAMGTVYRAVQPALNRRVAVKTLTHPRDPAALDRFKLEISALGRLSHPNFVKIYCAELDAEPPFFVMELLEGIDLHRIWQRLVTGGPGKLNALWYDAVTGAEGELLSSIGTVEGSTEDTVSTSDGNVESIKTPARHRRGTAEASRRVPHRYDWWIADVVRQVALAAHEVHQANLVHRDIKPANIMVTCAGTKAVLMDLGVVHIEDEVSGRPTMRDGDFVGTYRFASPQQLDGPQKSDPRNDVYSLGATLWELLALRPLFDADSNTSFDKLRESIRHEPPGNVRKHRKAVPQDLESIAMKCLSKNLGDRYETASEVAAELTRWLENRAVKAYSSRRGYQFRKHIRRNITRYVAGAACFVVIVSLIAYAAISYRREKAAELQAHVQFGTHYRKVADTLAPLGHGPLRKQFLEESYRELHPQWQRYKNSSTYRQTMAVPFAETCLRLAAVEWELGNLGVAQSYLKEVSNITEGFANVDNGDPVRIDVGLMKIRAIVLLVSLARDYSDCAPRIDAETTSARDAMNESRRTVLGKELKQAHAFLETLTSGDDVYSDEVTIQRLRVEYTRLLIEYDDRESDRRSLLEALVVRHKPLAKELPLVRREIGGIHNAIGALYFDARNFKQAKRHYILAQEHFKGLNNDTVDVFAENTLADTYFNLGLLEIEAQSVLQKLGQWDELSADEAASVVEHVRTKVIPQFEKAAFRLEKLARRCDDMPRLWSRHAETNYWLGFCYENTNDETKAVTAYIVALDSWDAHVEALERLGLRATTDPIRYYAASEYLHRRGDIETAKGIIASYLLKAFKYLVATQNQDDNQEERITTAFLSYVDRIKGNREAIDELRQSVKHFGQHKVISKGLSYWRA